MCNPYRSTGEVQSDLPACCREGVPYLLPDDDQPQTWDYWQVELLMIQWEHKWMIKNTHVDPFLIPFQRCVWSRPTPTTSLWSAWVWSLWPVSTTKRNWTLLMSVNILFTVELHNSKVCLLIKYFMSISWLIHLCSLTSGRHWHPGLRCWAETEHLQVHRCCDASWSHGLQAEAKRGASRAWWHWGWDEWKIMTTRWH